MGRGHYGLKLYGADGSAFDLLPHVVLGEVAGYSTAALADGSDLGTEPEVVISEVLSQLEDGAVAQVSSVGNRTIPLALKFAATASSGLTKAERDLQAICDQAVGLGVQHWDGLSPETVFDVEVALAWLAWDDMAETRTERVWNLSITARPWPRSAEPVTVTSSAASGLSQARTFNILGTKPAEVSLLVEGLAADGVTPANLGDHAIVYTRSIPDPSAASASRPLLMTTYRTSGPSRTTDVSRVSGGYSTLTAAATGAETFQVPVAELDKATYLAVALCRVAAGSGTVPREIDLSASANLPGAATVTSNETVQVPAGSWGFVDVGLLDLPNAEVDGDPGTSSVTLNVWAPAGDVQIDALLLADVSTNGELSIIATPTADSVTGVRVDAPTTRRPMASYWSLISGGSLVVNSASRVESWGRHRFTPGANRVEVITTGNTHARMTGTYFPRWAQFADLVADTSTAGEA